MGARKEQGRSVTEKEVDWWFPYVRKRKKSREESEGARRKM